MWSVFDTNGLWRGTTNDEESLSYIISMVVAQTGVMPVIIEEEDYV